MLRIRIWNFCDCRHDKQAVVAASVCKFTGCDEQMRNSAEDSERYNCWTCVFVFLSEKTHSEKLDELFFLTRGDHSTRFAPTASLEHHASQVESQLDGAEACRHQGDAPRECDHLAEGEGVDSRCEALEDWTRSEEERGQAELRQLLEPQQQPDLRDWSCNSKKPADPSVC